MILKVGDLQEICLEEEEIVILLSNLLDNAIRESETVLKNTGKAVIHLKLECEDHKLIFAVRNPVTEKVEIENEDVYKRQVMCMAPIIIFYLFSQKYIVKGITEGAIK